MSQLFSGQDTGNTNKFQLTQNTGNNAQITSIIFTLENYEGEGGTTPDPGTDPETPGGSGEEPEGPIVTPTDPTDETGHDFELKDWAFLGEQKWTNSYVNHTVDSESATLTFYAAKMQSGTQIDDRHVVRTNDPDVIVKMKDGKGYITGATIDLKKWGSDAISIKYTSKAGEGEWTEYSSETVLFQSGNEQQYTIENLPANTTEVKLTFTGDNGKRAGIAWIDLTIDFPSGMEIENDGAHGYIVKTNGEHNHEAFTDAKATHYDVSALKEKSETEEHNAFNVSNPNALVIFHYEAAENFSTNANLVKKQDDETLKADKITIKAEHPYAFGKDVEATEVEFTREMNETAARQYVTMVLPFDMSNTVNGKVSVLNSLSEDGTALRFTSKDDATIPAYTPFLYNAAGQNMNLTGNGNIKKATAEEGKTLVIVDLEGANGWKAAYATEETVIENVATEEQLSGYEVYYIQEDKFYRATMKLTAKPFRCFFLMPKNSTVQNMPAMLRFYIDDDVPMGLEEMYRDLNVEGADAPAYNAAGVRVGDDYRGIKVQGGKKVLVK